ncbi:DUF4974 domain-containing protein [Chitinophaga sedimenti]|uniref:FecR family protein n=1 Tax=Chitinophaga sedimenti TaxID=2033606 RepID=UPI0020041A7D|nr:FecR family protein [Chitinophaga sedimenti]MCK7555747.1 DUF4974 domain-containing protein [Chitinophaga sedimenti]
MNKRIDFLFSRYLARTCTPEELQELSQLLADPANEVRFRALIDAEIEAGMPLEQLPAGEAEQVFREVLQSRQPRQYKRWWLAAACLLLLAVPATLLLQRSPSATITPQAAAKPITPGSEGAILTLGNGQSVLLDSTRHGLISVQGGSNVTLQKGTLAYTNNTGKASVQYNKLETPRGRQFRITLSDGTIAWLNAASSLRYPTGFNGNSREVEITGEAYFEVAAAYDAQHRKIPFIVKINEQTSVEVLGTHFNINAYDDEESIRTTLLEGSVNIHNNGKEALLKPGQQARIHDHIKIVENADVAQAVAWKNGMFHFSGRTGIAEVMRQIARWYDVEVKYEKGVPDLVFSGKMQRNLNLDQVLKGLSSMDVHFKTEGRTLTVSP